MARTRHHRKRKGGGFFDSIFGSAAPASAGAASNSTTTTNTTNEQPEPANTAIRASHSDYNSVGGVKEDATTTGSTANAQTGGYHRRGGNKHRASTRHRRGGNKHRASTHRRRGGNKRHTSARHRRGGSLSVISRALAPLALLGASHMTYKKYGKTR